MAFAKYYWSESSRAAHVGDTSTLKKLYEEECDPCKEYVDLVNKDINKGFRTDSIPTTVKKTKVTDDANGRADQAVTLTATDAAHEYIDESGDAVGKVERLDYRVIIYVDWQGGEWTVVDSFMIT